MHLHELKSILLAHPGHTLACTLPGGGRVPRHFHVTEVGHVAKKFVDCGGTVRASDTCVLQVWTGRADDDGHRLTGAKLGRILDLARPVLPDGPLPVEIEHDEGGVSQFPIESATAADGELVFRLATKHAACLAPEKCGANASDAVDNGCSTDATTTAGAPAGTACCGGGKTACCG
jgi:hypothetical protein